MATLLIVDDEKDICEVVEDTFNAEKGFVILKAISGSEAVDLVKAHRPDVILLDIKLYGMLNGIDVLKEIKRHHPRGKVIVITGFTDDEEDRKIKELGIDAYLEKPFTPPEIVKIVKETLEKKWSEERG